MVSCVWCVRLLALDHCFCIAQHTIWLFLAQMQIISNLWNVWCWPVCHYPVRETSYFNYLPTTNTRSFALSTRPRSFTSPFPQTFAKISLQLDKTLLPSGQWTEIQRKYSVLIRRFYLHSSPQTTSIIATENTFLDWATANNVRLFFLSFGNVISSAHSFYTYEIPHMHITILSDSIINELQWNVITEYNNNNNKTNICMS